jgi:hypothetical protein
MPSKVAVSTGDALRPQVPCELAHCIEQALIVSEANAPELLKINAKTLYSHIDKLGIRKR